MLLVEESQGWDPVRIQLQASIRSQSMGSHPGRWCTRPFLDVFGFFWMRLYRALRGYSCGTSSRGFLESSCTAQRGAAHQSGWCDVKRGWMGYEHKVLSVPSKVSFTSK